MLWEKGLRAPWEVGLALRHPLISGGGQRGQELPSTEAPKSGKQADGDKGPGLFCPWQATLSLYHWAGYTPSSPDQFLTLNFDTWAWWLNPVILSPLFFFLLETSDNVG